MNFKAKWIIAENVDLNTAPLFRKQFQTEKEVKHADLYITALGVYEAKLNGERVGDFLMAPGWTTYRKRLQYQCYDVTAMLEQDNELLVTVGRGWYGSVLGWREEDSSVKHLDRVRSLLAELHISYADGSEEVLVTDSDWQTAESPVRFSEIYDGEHYDASFVPSDFAPAAIYEHTYDVLVPQEGETVRVVQKILPKRIFTTPKGEIMVDFGQEITGFVEFTVDAKAGDQIHILHSEVMFKDGNFYNENYRSAKAEICYTCKDGLQTYHPLLTFFGFRYIKLDRWPTMDVNEISLDQFSASFVCSDMKRTGFVRSSSAVLNQLFSNIFYSQMGNFLDVPTDCPQRDERLGWTGDAQVFCKAASYNFDSHKFYRKWLHEVQADQRPDGGIPWVIPDVLFQRDEPAFDSDPAMVSSAWGDVCCILPWQVYMTYGDKSVLEECYPMMKRWISYIQHVTTTEDMWTGGTHYGDWLGLDAPSGSYKGSTPDDFVSTAFYSYSLSLVIKTGRILSEDVSEYEAQYERTLAAFRKTFPVYERQTEHALAIRFGLCEDSQKTADSLAELVQKDGFMKTGFLGTPYILHVLTEYGYGDLAYALLLREEYPSWLFSVKQGATSIWEHWDGIMEDGSFWSKDMNSYNHYSYGAVIDWVYEKALGMRMTEDGPGFTKVVVAPVPTKRLDFLEGSIDTVSGKISSKWVNTPEGTRYEITIPVAGTIIIDDSKKELPAGTYVFFGK